MYIHKNAIHWKSFAHSRGWEKPEINFKNCTIWLTIMLNEGCNNVLLFSLINCISVSQTKEIELKMSKIVRYSIFTVYIFYSKQMSKLFSLRPHVIRTMIMYLCNQECYKILVLTYIVAGYTKILHFSTQNIFRAEYFTLRRLLGTTTTTKEKTFLGHACLLLSFLLL